MNERLLLSYLMTVWVYGSSSVVANAARLGTAEQSIVAGYSNPVLDTETEIKIPIRGFASSLC